ncbi:glycosyltransferase family 2 protein [Patescibacteria group bacterium]|nr:glycosyltransferase family 2 protein [Patescibacteria group bacterium]
MKPKISIAIVTFNEEKHIKECLESARFADEVVVVDGTSSDNTVKIAKQLKAKVFVVPNQPLMKKNMNLAFEKCLGDWIFSLDADERITPELQEEIGRVISDPQATAYRVPRKNIIFGKWIENSRWYPDWQLRLFKNGKAKFPAKHVHEELEVDGNIGQLENAILHLNWVTVSDFLLRFDSYTTREAEKLISESKEITWRDAIKMPTDEFLSRYFFGQGYRDGLHGLVLALLMAFYMEVTFAKIWERKGFWQRDVSLNDCNRQFLQSSRDYKYWLFTEQMKDTKNPLKLFSHKLKRRFR